MKSRLVIFLFALVSCYIISNTSREWNWWVYKWDKAGYHLYLPATFVYNDIAQLEFYPEIEAIYGPSGNITNYALTVQSDGSKVNKYNIGLALHEMPFFLIAHYTNLWFLNYRADGYSLPYEWATLISSLFWACMGLLAVRKFLLYYYSENITAITLLLIAFGTGLYHAVVFTGGMVHGYAFFQFAMVLLFTDRLYRTEQKKYFYGIAVMLGLVAITRSSDILIVIIPLLWGINSLSSLKERISFFKFNIGHIAIALLVFIITISPQLFYWKYTTGQWLYYGYADEGFIWTEPRILKGLFGFQKGWYIYTPIAFFATVGLYNMHKRCSQYFPAIVIFMSINVYVIFCWWQWWYGGSFGCRPLIESMAIMSLPLAAFLEQVSNIPQQIIKWVVGLLLFLLVPLNMFQSYQQFKNVIHWDKMTAEYYYKVFLKSNTPEGAEQYLMSEQEMYDILEHRKAGLKKK